MYVLLIIIACLAVLYVFQNKLESFVNNGRSVKEIAKKMPRPQPQVKRVNVEKFTSNRNNQATVIEVESAGKTNKYGDEIYQCEGGPFKIQYPEYRSKYDATRCIPCQNPPKCNGQNSKCMNENTYYYTLDNCVQDGNCRLGEDQINLSPIKGMC
jgi:hypothetical protein